MKVQAIDTHVARRVDMEGAKKVKMRMLIGPEEGAPHFHMRHFELVPGGHTPHHQHDYEHEIVILKGQGVAKSEAGDRPFKAGDIIYVPAGEKHQFLNPTKAPLEFICLIPAPQDCAQ